MPAHAISIEKLQVNCNLNLFTLLKLDIKATFNNHAMAKITARFNPEEVSKIHEKLSGQPLSVVNGHDDTTLFFGTIVEIDIAHELDYATITLTAYSLSWFLDLEKKYRSFQNIKMTYKEIFQNIVSDYDTSVLYNLHNKTIDKPYIQYGETDWEFMKRLASQLGAPIIPAMQEISSSFYVGLPTSKVTPIKSDEYSLRLDPAYIKTPDAHKKEFVFYEFTSHTALFLGQPILFNDTNLHVYSVNIMLEKNLLNFTYQLATKKKCKRKPSFNSQLKGLSLTGTVIETKAEQLKIHLDMDEDQSVEEAYFYTWLPETGNIMYSMPEMGSNVSLYIQTSNEQTAICINNVRQNGAGCSQTQVTDNRYFATKYQKDMSFKPHTMEMISLASDTSVFLDDNFGQLFNSSVSTLIQADGTLQIKGSTVSLQARKEVTVVKRDIGKPTVLNLCYNVDTDGNTGNFVSTGKSEPSSRGNSGSLTKQTLKEGQSSETAEMEKRKKLKFELAELLGKQTKDNDYDVSDIYPYVLSSIPQNIESNLPQYALPETSLNIEQDIFKGLPAICKTSI